MRAPLSLTDSALEQSRLNVLGLADVSALARLVVKGPAAAELLASCGLPAPDVMYGHMPLAGGGLVVRTGGAEFFLEEGPLGADLARLEEALATNPPNVYRVPRQDVSLLLAGREALTLLGQTCGYHFAAGGGQFVFTQVVGVACSARPRQLAAGRVWQLWADGTYGPYLWETLVEIAAELGGGPVGLETVWGPTGATPV